MFGNCYTITYEHLDAEIQIPEQSLLFFGPKYNMTYKKRKEIVRYKQTESCCSEGIHISTTVLESVHSI